MTNVSKRVLSSRHKKQLFEQFASLFAVSNTRTITYLFTDLCTDVEQTMLVKRLAAILMLHANYSRYRIAQTLCMSESTVCEIQKKFDQGTYSHIICATKQKQFEKEQFWETVESLVRLGMPSMGKDRWKGIV